MSFVYNLLIRAVTEPLSSLTFMTLSPLRSSSVHAHVFLHELSLHFRNLLDDLSMFDHGNRVDAHHASHQVNQLWLGPGHSLLHLLCLIPRNLLDDFRVFSDWSFLKHLAEGSRADRLARMASTMTLSKFVAVSGHGCSLRVIHVFGIGVTKPLPRVFVWARVDANV